IQFQSRFSEQQDPPARAAQTTARIGGPVIATAATATAAGFLVLLLSPVPMVRSFGAVLVLGIVLAFAVALLAGFAVLGADLRLRRPAAALAKIPRAAWIAAAAVAAIVALALLLSFGQLMLLLAI